MSNKNIENGLALIGAMLVLVGVTFAVNSALADETDRGRAPTTTAQSAPLSKADRANREAADSAADRIALDNKLDLEIRLYDRTSTIVAR